MEHKLVIGCTFGDEGKGQVVHALCNDMIAENKKPIVVRYSGGQQAGHTVRIGDKYHIFSCFGSGTFAGCKTYWTKDTVIDPIRWLMEKSELEIKCNVIPEQLFDPFTMITTPFDVFINHQRRSGNTVGCGIWETIERERLGLSIYVRDLAYPSILRTKLKSIKTYVQSLNILSESMLNDIDIDRIIILYTSFYNQIDVVDLNLFDHDIIYESSQGILLDPEYGLGGHSITTPISLINGLYLQSEVVFIFRSYLTRHGNGPVCDAVKKMFINPYETNVLNKHQGEFQTFEFNPELICYGADLIRTILNPEKIIGVETCCDINGCHDLNLNVPILHSNNPKLNSLCNL